MLDVGTYFIYMFLLLITVFSLSINRNPFRVSSEPFNKLHSRFHIHDVLPLLLICIIAGFRVNVGVDWEAYRDYFYDLKFYDYSFSSQQMEAGYFYINKVIDYFNFNHTMVFFLMAGGSWFVIFKSFPQKFLPFTVFFLFCDGYFFWSLNGVRQFLAIAIFAFSIKYIVQRQLSAFLLALLIGSFFHKTIFLLIPLYYLPYNKLYNQKYWIIAFFISFFIAQSSLALNLVADLFSSVSSQVPFLRTYNRYLDSNYYKVGDIEGSGLVYMFRMLTTFLIILISKPIVNKYPVSKIYFIIFFIGVILSNLFFMVQIIERFLHYFIFFKSFLLSLIVYYLYNNSRGYYVWVAVVVMVVFFGLYSIFIYSSYNLCCPYQFSLT